MRLPSRARVGELARWAFFRQGERRLRWRELVSGIVIILIVSLVNTACQQKGLYDRLEWLDLDRQQQTAPMTDAGGISLVLIDDDDYKNKDLFNATSPLDPKQLATLIASVCEFDPLVVGVDLLTSDWSADAYEVLVAQKMGDCPLIWTSDDEIREVGEGANRTFQVRVGKTLGQVIPPAETCTAGSVMQPDADGIIRRYTLSLPRMVSDEPSLASGGSPTMIAMLAGYDPKQPCTPVRPSSDDATVSKKIRYTSNDLFKKVPVPLLLEAKNDTTATIRRTLKELLEGRIVIIGGAYRQARDKHPTPIGSIHGAELIANAVYTERWNPIVDVRWWQSLALDITVSLALLLALAWSGLRWPWATLGSFILTAMAAILISWGLYRYLGYFLGVLGGLMGVVLAELTSIVWQPLREMWRGWWRDYPAPAADDVGEVALDAHMIEQPAAAQPAVDKSASQPADRPTPQHPVGKPDP